MDRIFLCRHGETEWSRSGQHTGTTDLPLTAAGKEQALLLGEKLKTYSFSNVYSSPLRRALDTCKLAGFHPIVEPLAKEWNYGEYEGLTSLQIAERNPNWNLFTQGTPGGESPEEIKIRADQLIHTLLQESGNVALFSHGHFLRVLAVRWLHLEPHFAPLFSLSVASMSILGFERKTRVIQLWNQTFS